MLEGCQMKHHDIDNQAFAVKFEDGHRAQMQHRQMHRCRRPSKCVESDASDPLTFPHCLLHLVAAERLEHELEGGLEVQAGGGGKRQRVCALELLRLQQRAAAADVRMAAGDAQSAACNLPKHY